MSRQKIYTSDSRIQIMDAKHILDEAEIKYLEINKMDSSYAGAFGSIELHVEEVDAKKAIEVLADLK
jgi:hypothetical protein